jgi:hypothetical protein
LTSLISQIRQKRNRIFRNNQSTAPWLSPSAGTGFVRDGIRPNKLGGIDEIDGTGTVEGCAGLFFWEIICQIRIFVVTWKVFEN